MKKVALFIKWDAIRERMSVTLSIEDGDTWIEVMERGRWNEFVRQCESPPLVVGGVKLLIEGDDGTVERYIQKYIRAIDLTFQKTGSTEFLGNMGVM